MKNKELSLLLSAVFFTFPVSVAVFLLMKKGGAIAAVACFFLLIFTFSFSYSCGKIYYKEKIKKRLADKRRDELILDEKQRRIKYLKAAIILAVLVFFLFQFD